MPFSLQKTWKIISVSLRNQHLESHSATLWPTEKHDALSDTYLFIRSFIGYLFPCLSFTVKWRWTVLCLATLLIKSKMIFSIKCISYSFQNQRKISHRYMCVHTCTYPYIFSTSFNPKNLCEELGSEAEPLSHITKPPWCRGLCLSGLGKLWTCKCTVIRPCGTADFWPVAFCSSGVSDTESYCFTQVMRFFFLHFDNLPVAQTLVQHGRLWSIFLKWENPDL